MNRGLQPCTGVCDQNDPQEKEMQDSKGLPQDSLQMAEQRREVKGKGKNECEVLENTKDG